MKTYVVMVIVLVLAFVGCQKKVTPPVPVGEMTEYKDLAYGFRIKYPKEWKQLGASGKAVFVKSQEVANKFLDPQSGEEGAQVTVEVFPLSGKQPNDIIDSAKDVIKQTWSKVDVQPDQQVPVGGKQGVKVGYSIPVTSKTNITGYEIYVAGDTAVYKLDFVGYGDQYTAHQDVFNAMLGSFSMPIVVVKSDKWVPSPNTEKYTSNFFTMDYPEDMINDNPPKGKFDLSMKLRAPDRYDCSIQIDVFSAQKLSVEKVFDQNKGRVKARGTGEAKIGGEKALWVEDQAMKDVMRRQYYVVKNDKVIRPTITWFVPKKDVYFPVLEKLATSLSLK